jgi:hypothetical protein
MRAAPAAWTAIVAGKMFAWREPALPPPDYPAQANGAK